MVNKLPELYEALKVLIANFVHFLLKLLHYYFNTPQPPKAAAKGKKSAKLTKAEKEKLKKEEAERKAKEEGGC